MIQEQTISFDKLVAALKEMNDKIGSLSSHESTYKKCLREE